MRIHGTTYRAFLFDVDRTLTDRTAAITRRTETALRALAKNYKIGVCTGRHFATLKETFRCFPEHSLHVVSGGAQIIDTTGKVQWERLIPYGIAMDIVRMFEETNAELYLQTDDRIFGNEAAQKQWNKNTPPIFPLEAFPAVDVPIITVDSVHQGVLETLSQKSEIAYTSMIGYRGQRFVDIVAHGVNKAVGIRVWCRLHHFFPGEVVGFGDSENDIEFLETVGYAVAVGNAGEEVKRIANEVIGSSDADGVAQWIEKHLSL